MGLTRVCKLSLWALACESTAEMACVCMQLGDAPKDMDGEVPAKGGPSKRSRNGESRMAGGLQGWAGHRVHVMLHA